MALNSNCNNNKISAVYRKKACKTVKCSSRFHDIDARWDMSGRVTFGWGWGADGGWGNHH